mgnify:FL=1
MRRSARALAAVLLLALPFAGSVVQAEPAPGAPPGIASPAGQATVLRVNNRPVATFRTSILGFDPGERAARADEVIRGLLREAGPGTIALRAIPGGQSVTLDGKSAFLVMDGDADALAGETPAQAVERAVAALRKVVEETREARRWDALGRASLAAGIASIVLVAALWLLVRVRAWIALRLANLASRHAERLRVGGRSLLGREQVITAARVITSLVFWLLVLLALHEWFAYALSRFPWTRSWGEGLQDATVSVAMSAMSGLLSALPNLAVAIAIFALAGVAGGAVNSFMKPFIEGEASSGWLDRDTARPTRNLLVAGLCIFAVAMAYPYLPGSHSDAFKGLSVLLGLMVSLGSTSIVGQAASGLILMYTRTVRPGEYVRIGDHEGTVVDLGAFTTRIRTGLGQELTLSNAYVAGAITCNYSRTVKGDGFIVDATVTIGYDTPWRQVEAMLVEAARRTPGVLPDPAPRVFQTALSDFSPEYRLVAQAIPREPVPRATVISALHAQIQDVFNEHGVQIMSPHYLGDPAEAKVVPKAKWHLAPARPPRSEGPP